MVGGHGREDDAREIEGSRARAWCGLRSLEENGLYGVGCASMPCFLGCWG